MSSCCVPYRIPFANVAFKDIQYTDDMKRNLGPYPKIEILAWDQDTQDYYSTNGIPGFEIKFDGNIIHVDFGGPGIGIVKIS